MMTVQETVAVEPNTRAAGKLVAKFVLDFKAALKSGNPITEAITIAGAALTDLAPVLGMLPEIKLEVKDDVYAEVTTGMLTGMDVVKALLS